MLAIIPEDSGSGRDLWNKINDTLLCGRALMLDSYRGQTQALGYATMVPRLGSAIDGGQLHSGDSVLFAIDNTGKTLCMQQIMTANTICQDNGIRMIATTYFCIEEVFISFKYTLDWVGKHKIRNSEALKLVRAMILNGEDYFTSTSEVIEGFIERTPGVDNREKMAYHLLRLATERSNEFRYTKRYLG